ncbi:uncharacterized protein LOC133315982 [Gastrolobium bilobum]|uniref:uncharacterized protein LOC133315982 n=1 Tax=Gastrolobium bilobum TaxID=150636 RepID=UPI002AB1E0DC|nr:uncharacterized protein LOC133315982 [Gastrolobium bilobum]
MDFMSKTNLLIVSLTSLLLLANDVSSSRDIHVVHRNLRSDLLDDFCKKFTNPTLCAETIQPHYNNHALDPLKALEIEVDATLNQTKKTAAIIDELLSKPDVSKPLKVSLDTCKEQYNSILDSIKETKEAIATHDVITAKFKFSAVLSFQATCKDEFEGTKMPFADDSEAIYQLGGNCLDMIADIEKTSGPQKEAAPVKSTPSAFSSVIGTISS